MSGWLFWMNMLMAQSLFLFLYRQIVLTLLDVNCKNTNMKNCQKKTTLTKSKRSQLVSSSTKLRTIQRMQFSFQLFLHRIMGSKVTWRRCNLLMGLWHSELFRTENISSLENTKMLLFWSEVIANCIPLIRYIIRV